MRWATCGLNPLTVNGQANNTKRGFTIVETLIFLAVSGAMFVSVAALVQGQINRQQSKDSVLQIESRVRNTLNDVSNGYYPDLVDSTVSCGGETGSERGKNRSCILVGKKLTFQNDKLTIETIVAPSGIATIADVGSQGEVVTDLTQEVVYKWDLKLVGDNIIYYILNNNYAPALNEDDLLVSGAQRVSLYYGEDLESVTNSNNKICLQNGGHRSSLVLTTSGALGVESKFMDESC